MGCFVFNDPNGWLNMRNAAEEDEKSAPPEHFVPVYSDEFLAELAQDAADQAVRPPANGEMKEMLPETLKLSTKDSEDSDASIRMECLSHAIRAYGDVLVAKDLVASAENFYKFVKGIKSNEGQA